VQLGNLLHRFVFC